MITGPTIESRRAGPPVTARFRQGSAGPHKCGGRKRRRATARPAVSAITCLLACLWALSGAASPALAGEGATQISEVAIGFNGRTKVGRWTPVTFRVSGTAGAVIQPTVAAPDPDGSETTWRLPDCTLDASGNGQVSGLFKIGRLAGRIRITAGLATENITAGATRDGDDAACVLRKQDVPFIVVLGAAPGLQAAFGDAGARESQTAPPVAETIVLDGSNRFPLDHRALDAVDVVVLSQQFDLDSDRSAAIADWVVRGGHAVIILGSDPEPFTDSKLGEWAPVHIGESATFRELASLVDRVPGSPPLNVASGIRGLDIESTDGQVLAATLSGPLAIRAPYGLGRVTVLAVDWSDDRIQQWTGLPGLCRYLTDTGLSTRKSNSQTNTQLRPTGVSELATQLSSQLDHFGVVARPSYWTIIGFAAAFMVLVGPLDYLLVHRVLKQPRLTWFTFPAWIVFAATAATLGAGRLNSSERQANQFDLVDIDRTSGLQRVHSRITIYSPESRRLRVESSVAPWLADTAPVRMPMAWSGAPETGFGGMYRQGGLNLATPPYSIAEKASAVVDVPIDEWSTKAFSADSSTRSDDDAERLVASNLADDGTGYLVGTITHRLPDEITGWCLAYGNTAVFPRDAPRADRVPSIPPNVPWRVDDRVSRRRLQHFLQGMTQRYVSSDDATASQREIQTTTYDPLGLDPSPLARMLTFYEAADGLGYTGLKNSSLSRGDLTRLLPLKRAVLFGRIASPAAEYVVDGDSVQPRERWTFVRIVLPVKPGQAPDPRDFDFPSTR